MQGAELPGVGGGVGGRGRAGRWDFVSGGVPAGGEAGFGDAHGGFLVGDFLGGIFWRGVGGW